MPSKNKPIYVTQPFLPPLEEFVPYLEQIWRNKWLTNGGPFHQKLEKELASYLGVEHLALFVNGTVALVTALQALRITGEVITTPFSFVATAHSLLWSGIKPVFVDIDPDTFNINPEKIEAAITPHTTAILPVHVYGNPCDVEKIQRIADTYGLKVVYDAAHAFGVKYKEESLLKHGDLSILSFHATKVFNTFEGGAIVSSDTNMKQRIDYLKNFGFSSEISVMAPGINGKMNEVSAAFGLLQLAYMDSVLDCRRSIADRYKKGLNDICGIHIPPVPDETILNASYFPIIIDETYPLSRDILYEKLKERDIYCRRYFYPLISSFPMYRGLPSAKPSNLPVASRIAEQVLCLPIYPSLDLDSQMVVIDAIRDGR